MKKGKGVAGGEMSRTDGPEVKEAYHVCKMKLEQYGLEVKYEKEHGA